jgi:hypothetical protein
MYMCIQQNKVCGCSILTLHTTVLARPGWRRPRNIIALHRIAVYLYVTSQQDATFRCHLGLSVREAARRLNS